MTHLFYLVFMFRDIEEGGSDRIFSKMVDIPGTQNRKIVELLARSSLIIKEPFMRSTVCCSIQKRSY